MNAIELAQSSSSLLARRNDGPFPWTSALAMICRGCRLSIASFAFALRIRRADVLICLLARMRLRTLRMLGAVENGFITTR